MRTKKLILSLSVVSLLLMASLAANLWFQQRYVGWLLASVPDSLAFKQRWQAQIASQVTIQHPAIIHVLPDGCLCRILSITHAQLVSKTASQQGFNVYQLASDDDGLGKPIAAMNDFVPQIAPLVVITRASGEIAYLGAYSDGIRCNTGTSMIDRFLDDPALLPKQAVIGLDVESCRCLDGKRSQ